MYTIYLDETNRVSIICQNCGLEQTVDTTNFKDTEKKLEGKCSCGVSYQFNIEFRQRYREDVSLAGEYFIQGIGEKGEITIQDLSMSGVLFECKNPHQISKDDLLQVKFRLDGPKRPLIRKHARVIWVKDRIIGADFIESKLYKEELQSYLEV